MPSKLVVINSSSRTLPQFQGMSIVFSEILRNLLTVVNAIDVHVHPEIVPTVKAKVPSKDERMIEKKLGADKSRQAISLPQYEPIPRCVR